MMIDNWEDNEMYTTAIHEAGHFVMGMVTQGGLPRSITIVPQDGYLGSCGGCPSEPKRAVLFCYAGGIACDMFGYEDGFGCNDDNADAESTLRGLYGDAWESVASDYYEFAFKILASHKGSTDAIRQIADYLMENPSLEQDAVSPLYEIAERAMSRCRRKMINKVNAFVQN